MKWETHEYSKYILLQILLFARLWRAWREWLHQSQNRSTIFQGNVKICKLQITFCFDWWQITFAGHLKWNLAVRQKVEAKHPEIPGTPEHLGLPSIIYPWLRSQDVHFSWAFCWDKITSNIAHRVVLVTDSISLNDLLSVNKNIAM